MLNQEQNLLSKKIQTLYPHEIWTTNPLIRLEEAILNNEEVSLKIFKKEEILLGPLYVNISLNVINTIAQTPTKLTLSNYIYYDLNNITKFIIEIDLNKEFYQISYSSEPLYEYGYEEENIDKMSSICQASSLKECINYFENSLNGLSSYFKNDKLSKKIIKSISNYFNLKKDKNVKSVSTMSSYPTDCEYNNMNSLNHFHNLFEKNQLEKVLTPITKKTEKIKL